MRRFRRRCRPPHCSGVTVTFIGDVHGWSERLDRVLAQAEGELVFMGDLIDRGPDAPGVIRRVRTLCAQGEARCLLGNHEYALVRSLGAPEVGVTAEPDFFAAWRDGFGGNAVLDAYGVTDADGLRDALGDHLAWLAALPWVLSGELVGAQGVQRWLAVHGGLADDCPAEQQLAELRAGWTAPEHTAEALFSKARMLSLPPDLPPATTVVSGHVPLPRAHVSPQRILCDTSGGQRHRALSGVIWPEGRVISSDG